MNLLSAFIIYLLGATTVFASTSYPICEELENAKSVLVAMPTPSKCKVAEIDKSKSEYLADFASFKEDCQQAEALPPNQQTKAFHDLVKKIQQSHLTNPSMDKLVTDGANLLPKPNEAGYDDCSTAMKNLLQYKKRGQNINSNLLKWHHNDLPAASPAATSTK